MSTPSLPSDLETARLELERERLALEKEKAKDDRRVFSRHLGPIIAAVVSLAAVLVSGAQVWVAYIAKEKELGVSALQRDKEFEASQTQRANELAATREQQEREWRLQIVRYVTEHKKEILSNDLNEQRLLRDTMLIAFPGSIVDPIFQRITVVLSDGPADRKVASTKVWTDGVALARRSSDWPPRPDFGPLLSSERLKLFGAFRFEPVGPDTDDFMILDDWVQRNIVSVEIPQLKGVRGAPKDGRVAFHRLGAERLKALWEAWEKAGLLKAVQSWEGSFAPRFVRGDRTILNSHSWGTAFDINYSWNRMGTVPALVGDEGSVRELVPIANGLGFYWGGHFSRVDGMHFELAVVDPQSVARMNAP